MGVVVGVELANSARMPVSDDMHELEQGKRSLRWKSDLLCHQQMKQCEAIVASAPSSGNKTMLQYDDVERLLGGWLVGERGMTEGWRVSLEAQSLETWQAWLGSGVWNKLRHNGTWQPSRAGEQVL